MPVQNRIVKVQKRNRALVRFDEARIWKAILRAAESIGGFRQDFLPGINDKIFDAYGAEDKIAEFLADAVVVSPSLMSREDVRDGVALTRKGGTCVLTGMAAQTTRSAKIALQDFILWNKNLVGTVFGSCNPRVDIARLARLYQTGQLQLDEMITKRYRLDDINDAYDDLLSGKLIRGVIDYGLK